MTRQETITLAGRVPSKKNSKRRIQRGTQIFMVPSAQHELWHTEMMHVLHHLRIGKKTMSNLDRIEMTFFAADRRRADLSNKAESVMDLLVDAKVINDDSWFEVPRLLLIFGGVEKDRPRVKVDIYGLA